MPVCGSVCYVHLLFPIYLSTIAVVINAVTFSALSQHAGALSVGFYGLSSAEIGNDSKDIETASSMMTVTHEKTKQEKDKERDKNKNSCGVVKKTLRPPCAPESTLFKKIQRYFHWANDPSLIPEDLKAYKEVVDKLHGELLELEMESIRWHANVNTVRAEFSNMESSLACQILEQESMESELYALLLREFASVEEVVKGDGSHSTRGKAAMTVEDVAARLASVDSVLTGQLEACVALTQAPLEQPEGDPEEALQGGGRVVDVVTDPLTGDVLLCSFQPPTVAEPEKADTLAASITDDSVGTTMEVVEEESLQSNATDTVVVAEVIGSVVDKVEVVAEKCGSSSLAESKDEEGQEVSSSVSSSAGPLLSSDTGLVEAAPPQLPAIVAYVEAKKRKIHEMKAADVFSETLHQGNGLLYALSLPDEVDRPHNYFKVKRLAGTEPPLGDRQRSEVEAQVSASKYSAAPLTAYMSLLQHPYKAGALEGLGQRPCPSTEGAAAATAAAAAAAATSSLKGRGRGGKASAGGGGGASSQSHGHSEAAVAMHMDALRRTPCEVPLVLSPFSSLEGWYAGTYQALAFPLPTPSQTQEQEQGSASRTATPSIEYNIENQEHFIHPQFIQVGEKYMSIINTLSSATQRAQIELADLEKEEAEWKAQVGEWETVLLYLCA